MNEVLVILVLLAACGLVFWASRTRLARCLSSRGLNIVRLAMAIAMALSMLVFSRPWVYPLFLGAFVGNLLAAEFAAAG